MGNGYTILGNRSKKKEETPQNLNLEGFPKNLKKSQKHLKKPTFEGYF